MRAAGTPLGQRIDGLGGHTHRVTDLDLGGVPVVQAMPGGLSYSTLQFLVRDGEVEWVGAQTRMARAEGVPPRRDVRRIVEDARAGTEAVRTKVLGTLAADVPRDQVKARESGMGDLVADSMRAVDPQADAALV